MDTDSAYIAISGENLKDIIKPNMKTTFEKSSTGFCSKSEIKADALYHWLPRTCCDIHKTFDKRTPGLFKLEFQGNKMIGLCSKTYMIKNDDITKMSSKGVSRKSITNPDKLFSNVLNDAQPA